MQAADQLARWCKENPSFMSSLMRNSPDTLTEVLRSDSDAAVIHCVLTILLNLAKAGMACESVNLDVLSGNSAISGKSSIAERFAEVREATSVQSMNTAGPTFEELMAEQQQQNEHMQGDIPMFDGICDNALVDPDKARANLLTLGARQDGEYYVVDSPTGCDITVGFQGQFMYLAAGDVRDFEEVVVQVRSDNPHDALPRSAEPAEAAVRQAVDMFSNDSAHYRLEAADQLARWTKEHPEHMSRMLAGAVRHLSVETDVAVARCILSALRHAALAGFACDDVQSVEVSSTTAGDAEVTELRDELVMLVEQINNRQA